ncbi:MAG TPA: peptidase [Glaciecola sp.]|jgi:lipoprotein NlpD|nr:peptidase [Glaciecola sp.]
MLLISLKIHHLSRLVLLSSLILLTACAGRPAPAPVIKINTQVQEISPWDNADTHQVQEGETLYGIAWLYGLDYQMLAQNNNLQEPFAIGVGQKLNLVKKTIKQASLSADTKEVIVKTPNRKTVAQNNKSVYRSKHKSETKKVSDSILPERVKRWVWPTKGTIVGTFSTAEAGIKGIEIANAIGTPVVSAAEGKVVYSGNALRGYGNLVIIKHTDHFLSAYAHNNKILVQERDIVQAGQPIAVMGDSGTNSAKLRFEIRYNGKSLDPLKYLPKQK